MIPLFLKTLPKKRLMLVTGAALLCAASFHPIKLHFLAWIGLVPLLCAIEQTTPARSFILGVIYGSLFSLFSMFWLVFLQIELNIKLIMFAGLVLLFLYHGMYYGVALMVSNRLGVWAFPLALCGLDFVRGIGEIGFPWLTFAYSQARYPFIIQHASLIGVYGLTLWLVAVNVFVYKSLKTRKFTYILATLLTFTVPAGLGLVTMPQETNQYLNIGIIQPNIDPNLKFTKTMREETFNRLIYLSEDCANDFTARTQDTLDVIVWPETAAPVFLTFPGTHQQRVLDLCNRLGVPIFTGTLAYEKSTRDVYNGAVLILPGPGIQQEYRKLHLVPFGEHIPYDQYIPWLRKIDVGGGDYRPGKTYTVFNLDSVRFSCLICFESIFPELARAFSTRGAQMLVNITNDGWFGKVSGPQQHNDMFILRAIENRVPCARSSNTGISMLVDARGRVLEETPLFEKTFLTGTVCLPNVKTLYQMIGDVVPIGSLIIITITLIAFYIKHRRL